MARTWREANLSEMMKMSDPEYRDYNNGKGWIPQSELDFTDYGDHLLNPRTGTCPICGANMCNC